MKLDAHTVLERLRQFFPGAVPEGLDHLDEVALQTELNALFQNRPDLLAALNPPPRTLPGGGEVTTRSYQAPPGLDDAVVGEILTCDHPICRHCWWRPDRWVTFPESECPHPELDCDLRRQGRDGR